MQGPRSFGSRPAHQRAEPARRSACAASWPCEQLGGWVVRDILGRKLQKFEKVEGNRAVARSSFLVYFSYTRRRAYLAQIRLRNLLQTRCPAVVAREANRARAARFILGVAGNLVVSSQCALATHAWHTPTQTVPAQRRAAVLRLPRPAKRRGCSCPLRDQCSWLAAPIADGSAAGQRRRRS